MSVTLVTGATGLVGSHVLRLLLERGDTVRATVRVGSNLERLEGLDVECVTCDIFDRQAVRRAMRGVTRVFHVAGVTSLRADSDALFRINVEATRVVLDDTPARGDWHAIYIEAASTGTVLDDVDLRYAGNANLPGDANWFRAALRLNSAATVTRQQVYPPQYFSPQNPLFD